MPPQTFSAGRVWLLLPWVLVLAACGTTRQPWYSSQYREAPIGELPDQPPAFTWLLIGDAGKLTESHVLYAPIQQTASQLPKQSAVVYLGDNIYPAGLPARDAPEYPEAEAHLNAQLKALSQVPGPVFFVFGNHDWSGSSPSGWDAVQRQVAFLDSALGTGAARPLGGCPGPEVVELDSQRVMIFLDTHWPMHQGPKPEGPNSPCHVAHWRDQISTLDALLTQYRGKTVLVAAHHPLYSNGGHGGRFTLGEHLFPLRMAHPKLYVPLPILGSIYPLLRKASRHYTDMGHPTYREYRQALHEVLNRNPGTIWANGHEHILQLNQPGGYIAITSGSGSKQSPAVRGRGADFVHGQKGFAILRQYANQQFWLDFWAWSPKSKSIHLVWRQTIGM